MKNSPARLALCSVITLFGMASATQAIAQAPAGATTASAPARVWSEAELDGLVASIALYPDDLLALVLPASTYPLDVVKAERFLERLKSNKDLKPDESLNESVRNLLNYPEIVRKMSGDLDWTQQLGNAVIDDQGAVMEAVQRFRRKAYAAKNLKTDDKQTVVVEDEVISLQPTKPDVIYVPNYDPVTVVVEQPVSYVGAPYYGYYPTAYPVYYYPYPPGYAFASGFFWGAVGAAWAMNWHGGHVSHHGDININNNNNINVGDGNRGQGDRGQGNRGDRNQVNPNDRKGASDRSSARTADRGAGGERWNPDRSNRQGASDRGGNRAQTGARPGDRSYSPRTASTFERGQAASQFNRAGNTASTGNRAGSTANRGGNASASTRPSNTGGSNRASSSNRAGSSSSRSASSRGGGSMSRYSSGRTAGAASSRGGASRGGGGRGGGGRGRR